MLGRLAELGYRVPAGIVLTVDTFFATLEGLGLVPAFDTLSDQLEAGSPNLDLGQRVARSIATGRLPRPICEAIEDALIDTALDDAETLIVRSSATVEDSSSASFAGIFESYPVPATGDVEGAIRQVYASVFAPRALAYARERGVGRIPAMAVVIQKFVEAERSGVMFTRFSLGREPARTLIEHVEGGCEKLVKGEVSPDRLWSEPGADVVSVEGPLSATYADELVKLGARLEEQLGGPQDVEWVIREGLLHVVQSRPITSSGDGGAPPIMDGDAKPLLHGVPAGPGVGAGRVHLAWNVVDALAIEQGDVLVTTMTNPDMVVAMRTAAAIVTDVGGMICHAAIVSRELGLPCVVGTEDATKRLAQGTLVTVDGHRGVVLEGRHEAPVSSNRDVVLAWDALVQVFFRAARDTSYLPLFSSKSGLTAVPEGTLLVALNPTIDLRCNERGLFRDIEALDDDARRALVNDYIDEVDALRRGRGIGTVVLAPRNEGLVRDLVRALPKREGFAVNGVDCHYPVLFGPLSDPPSAPVLLPVGAAVLLAQDRTSLSALRADDDSEDMERFFGHRPQKKRSPMPSPERRQMWRDLLPQYDAFCAEEVASSGADEHTWLELRPEIVISPMLKSVVMPGFEMIPHYLGIEGIGPMSTKWIRCRYHLREDKFEDLWAGLVAGTWNRNFLAEMLRNVRRSYASWQALVKELPSDEGALAALDANAIVALILRWWPELVEFFSLNWFEQAQGEDILYPYIEAVVNELQAHLGPPPKGISWPWVASLVAPTTPVESGEYMGDMSTLRSMLLDAGLTTLDAALHALEANEHPAIAAQLATHLAKWHWMRDRDLLFEPWDTPRRVIETALTTQEHRAAPYAENLARNLFATSFWGDLAGTAGATEKLQHAIRFLQDMRFERENHHLMWLRCSHGLRRLLLEIERRLVAVGGFRPGDVFFLQLPELLAAAKALPAPIDGALAARARARRAGYRFEAKLSKDDDVSPVEEDDYY